MVAFRRSASTNQQAPAEHRPAPKARPALTIVNALDDERLFKPWFRGDSWNNWRTVLKAAYGLPLTDDETIFFKSIAGGREPPDRQVRELWIIAGRRAGKDAIASAVAAFAAALFDQQDRLRRGERGLIACLGVDRNQSRIILDYIKAFFSDIPMLNSLVTRSTAIGFQLRNSIDIEVATNSFRSIRGRPFAVAILDECAYYMSENSATPDLELYKAIVPGMATLPNSMIIGISTPYKRSGLLFQKHKDHFGREGDVLVIVAPTTVLNPTIDPAIVARALEADPAAARSEWMAEFRSDVGNWVSAEMIEAAVDQGVIVRPPMLYSNIAYHGACDPAGGSGTDSFTASVAHVDINGDVVLDNLLEIRPPYSPTAAVDQAAGMFKSYGLNSCVGDRYSALWCVEGFAKVGIEYKHSERNRSEIYLDCLPLFTSGRARILDNKRLINQFASLERKTSSVGKDRVNHPVGGHEDCANAAALAMVLAAAPESKGPIAYFTGVSMNGGPDSPVYMCDGGKLTVYR